jgi:hypothetical protein
MIDARMHKWWLLLLRRCVLVVDFVVKWCRIHNAAEFYLADSEDFFS